MLAGRGGSASRVGWPLFRKQRERYRLSLRASRRSLIAALTVGASLAVASSASAIPVPIGSSTDPAYSGTGAPTSVFSLYNQASNVALVPAQNLIVLANGILASQSQPPVDKNFPTAFTSASSLNSTNVAEIATDIAAAGNANNLEFAVCVDQYLAAHSLPPTSSNIQTAAGECQSNASTLMPPAITYFTGTIQPGVAQAAAAWPDLSQLVSFLAPAAGIMQSADSASLSSSGTVTSLTNPVQYNLTLTAPTGGYVVPSAFSLTFPAGLSVNTALVADEVNAAANGATPAAIAAIEASPPSSAVSIGTVTLTSPLADEFGGTNNQLTGNIYVVTTGASSGQGSATQPYLELWFSAGGHPIYDLGSFPSSLAFPLTLTFGEAYVSLLGAQEPLPLNSLSLSFPEATSPVKTTSCSTLGTVTGAITDSIASLAYEFGDAADGASSAAAPASPVGIASTPTMVTNQCATATGSARGLNNGKVTMRLKITTGISFGTIKIGLPKGLKFVKASKKMLRKEVSIRARSIRIAHGKLVITLKGKTKAATITTKKGLIAETHGLIKSVKKHKTKTLSFSVSAGNTALKVSVKA